MTQEPTIPWANGLQAGFLLQRLRGEVLAQLY
jgi:hypothetical protein